MSGRPAQRLTDKNSAGGVIVNTDGNTNVYTNNLLSSVDTSVVDYQPGNTATANGSGVVFIANQPFNFTDNADEDGAVRIGGSDSVYVGDDVDQDTIETRAINEGDEEDLYPPDPVPAGQPQPTSRGQVYIEKQVEQGKVSPKELSKANTPVEGKADPEPPKNPTAFDSNCSDIHLIFNPVPPAVAPTGDAIDAVPLTTGWTVGRLTRSPNVTFNHPLRAPSAGLSVEEIVCNLKLLTVNCIVPIKARFPNLFITNTFRPSGIGSPTSQHPRGQAADMQFRGVTKKDYFEIAQVIKDLVPYDQLLLEYKTTGSGLPWIHISFNKAGNRRQVLTFLNDRTYAQGLKDLSGTALQ